MQYLIQRKNLLQHSAQGDLMIKTLALYKKKAKIGIVGLSFVGLPVMLLYAETGFKAICINIDAQNVIQLSHWQSYIEHIPHDKIKWAGQQAGFKAKNNFEKISKADDVVLATNHDRFDYKMIFDNAQLIIDTRGRYLKPNSKV